ncbi:hypothetical protein [Bosea sp. 117]|uniref:hypothetical protein n=1 Tax=Bosea sp. 117 TaxID=1125973 RepID=UPI0020C0CC2D|nr:hypothetical protein [Bosea sp. 117]
MSALRSMLVVAFAWLVTSLPAAASSIADHEPARGALMLGVVFVAALSWVMAYRRWWLPLLVWLPLALGASIFIGHLVDPTVSAVIRDELGLDYLMEADLCIAIAVVAPLMIAQSWMGRREMRR